MHIDYIVLFAFEKVEVLHSDRQLRPRIHRRTQTVVVQRSDGEEEDLGETRRSPVRIFRIESDPALCQDEQQDGFVPMLLADLIKHMHPYSLKVTLEKECLTATHKLEEEDVFVDVEGDDDDMRASAFRVDQSFGINGILKDDEPLFDQQDKKDKVGMTVVSSGRVKKKVTFASNLVTVHEYQPDLDGEPCKDWQFSESLKLETCDLASVAYISAPKTNAKSKTLSLQEYRLLRKNTTPSEGKKLDHRTKWPSIPRPPKELRPIQFNPGYISAQVHSHASSVSTKTSTPRAVNKTPVKAPLKQIKPAQSSDPPNPVTVPLIFDKETNSAARVQQVLGLAEDLVVEPTNGSSTVTESFTSCLSAPSTPLKSTTTQTPQFGAEERKKEATGEIGDFRILKSDVLSLMHLDSLLKADLCFCVEFTHHNSCLVLSRRCELTQKYKSLLILHQGTF